MLGDPGVYEERWNIIQIGFVEAPRRAVQNDRLVTEAMEDLARIVVSHRDAPPGPVAAGRRHQH